MRADARLALRGMNTRSVPHRRGAGIASAMMAMTILAASISLAPSAVADSEGSLRAAVMSVRSASCGPLRSDPLVERVAAEVARATDLWLDHRGRVAPVDDPLPLLKDLGYGGNKALLLQGAGFTDARAIKGLLLEGHLDLPDCSYTDYGVSVMHNRTTDYTLAVVLLAA